MGATINVITAKADWFNALNHYDNYDFYHTYDYHELSKEPDDQPVMLEYKSYGALIHIPFLIRPIPLQNGLYDAISVYGYSGPLFNKKALKKEVVSDFTRLLVKWFDKNSIISAFCRLHPYISDQCKVLGKIGKVDIVGQTVNINLNDDIDMQRGNYSKITKRHLNKLEKICTVEKSRKKEDLKTFIEIYLENMNRVKAKEYYYFKQEYFSKMLQSKDFETDLILVKHTESNKIIAGAMMVKTNKIIQYHLSGTLNEFLGLTPIRLCIDHMRLLGTKQGFRHFNLGGGLGGGKDSLFTFKSSFSKDFKDFKVWKYVANKKMYSELVSKAGINPKENSSSYFPLYRFDTKS